MNPVVIIAITGAIVVILLTIIWGIVLLGQRMRHLEESMDKRLESREKIDSTFATTITGVSERLGELKASYEELIKVKDSMEELGELLRPPKLRGDIGELLLETILNDILGSESFSMPYGFKSGVRVDAVIRIGERLLPIDSKFPLDNFRKIAELKSEEEKRRQYKLFVQDVKAHIDDIAQKYILPDEGTFDFAFMYIPAENVYYETIVKYKHFGEENLLFDHATRRMVFPISPNTLYPYLSIIVRGLRGFKIEESAKQILDKLSGLKQDLTRFKDEFQTLGSHITHASNKYYEVDKALDRFTTKLLSVEEPAEERRSKSR